MAAFYSQPAVVPIGYDAFGQGWSQVPGQISAPQYAAPQYAWPQGQMFPAQYGQTAVPGWTQVPCQTGFANAGTYQSPELMQSGQLSPSYPQSEQHDPVDILLIELGVQPHEDINFAWIAEYALQSEVLAPRWGMHTDVNTGRVYYVDTKSGNTSWENPLLECLRQVIDIGRRFTLKTPEEATGFFTNEKDVLWNLRKQELDCWHGPFDNGQGRCYYSNSASGVSSWQDPREEMQFMYELETKLLDALEETLEPLGPDVLPSFGFGMDEAESGMRRVGQAEVLTIDDQDDSPGKARKKEVPDEEDHRSVFEEMVKVADYMHFLHRDEEEVQHLLMSRKVKERRMRKRRLVEEEERKLRQEEELRAATAAAEEEKKAEIIRQIKEQQQKEEEARQLRLAKEEAERKEQERIEEEQRQKELAERAAEAEAQRLKEERRLQEIEEKRIKELEKRQKLLQCIEHAVASRKLESLRSALAEGKAAGLDEELEPLLVVLKEVLIASVEEICKCRDCNLMQLAIADYESFGMSSEAEMVKKALEEELATRKAASEKARKAKEELAAQFKDAKEAHDFGGAILAAQWRAAVREISKPQ